MLVTSWNLLHGASFPPTNDLKIDQERLHAALENLGSDIIGIQEVDHLLERSGNIAQTQFVASAIDATDWGFAPTLIGTPGYSWRPIGIGDDQILTNKNQAHIVGGYGIGIASKIPVNHWNRLELRKYPIGKPVILKTVNANGSISRSYAYFKDEPRVALAATLENGWTVVNTHLSFVPIVNLIQLYKVKRWAHGLGKQYKSKILIIGDLNLPHRIPSISIKWKSLILQLSFPSDDPRVQIDYVLSNSIKPNQVEALKTLKTGMSDHLPISVQIPPL